MKNNYHKAYTEVLEILKYMSQEEVKKIPKETLLTLKEKSDKNYIFKMDTSKGIEKQELLEETKDILANFFRDYWAVPAQKEIIIKKENEERRVIEEEKRKLYNPDNIFKNENKENKIIEEQQSITIIEKTSLGKKIIDFLKKIFKRG